MLPYSTILFDIDDTLVDFKRSEKISLKNCHLKFFQNVPDFAVFEKEYVKINRALWRQVELGTITTTFLAQERFKQVAECFKIPLNIACIQYYAEQLIEHSQLIEGALELLERLKRQGMKIGFLTNGFAYLQHNKYKNLDLARYSNVLVISEEVGFSKPHPEIFRQALLSIKSRADETLMVGDSLESDGKGAKQSGMGFCWYNANQAPNSLDWEPELIISDLDELYPATAGA
jgi:YjjG family noncanonical pyrimidine nucleotidase